MKQNENAKVIRGPLVVGHVTQQATGEPDSGNSGSHRLRPVSALIAARGQSVVIGSAMISPRSE
jgi:hypothetical protein